MLARKHKLDPSALFAGPRKTVRGRYILVTYAPAHGTDGTFAVIVPGTVAPRAVLRHRLKRALFGEAAAARPYPFDVAVSVRTLPAENASRTLADEFQELLTRIRTT
jgi:RNase P protein component